MLIVHILRFVEGANIARNNNDHLWHGKALNGIGVCLVILAYLGAEFQVFAWSLLQNYDISLTRS